MSSTEEPVKLLDNLKSLNKFCRPEKYID